ncbi:hypothetical protein H4Q26_008770 [Puccinia striiformis f. sp. tritici PST-130]|nr:hypothetical protein H4Q26_008770 [Puccinia striiformis f. sp. tritici PST-130]
MTKKATDKPNLISSEDRARIIDLNAMHLAEKVRAISILNAHKRKARVAEPTCRKRRKITFGKKNPSHTDLDSHTSKRSACHLMNDIIHNSNSIDHRSKPNSAPPLELLLDNQPSRINDKNRVPSQNSLPKSLSKRITKSNLINRIALPSRDLNLAFTYDSIALTKKRIHFVTQKVHSEHSPTVSLSTIAILKQHRLPLDIEGVGSIRSIFRLKPFNLWGGGVLCWNLIPSSNSLKRKNPSHTDLNSHTSKRSACHLMNDIIHNSNSIDHRSKPNSAPPLELLLDNQPSRTNNENRVPSQNSLPKSLSKRITKSNLIDRIALPSRGKISISLYSFYTRKTKRTNLHITFHVRFDSFN